MDIIILTQKLILRIETETVYDILKMDYAYINWNSLIDNILPQLNYFKFNYKQLGWDSVSIITATKQHVTLC